MFWNEDNQENSDIFNNKIVDVSFKVDCQKISLDHAYDLYEAINQKIPEINTIDNLAIHSIYGAESGAGWERPKTEIYLSKRTRFCIRTPIEYADKFFHLNDQTLNIGKKYLVKLSKPTIKKLIITDTIFCRSVIMENIEDEDSFLSDVNSSLSLINIKVKKMLCGKDHYIKTPKKILRSKSLLITNLEKEDSIKIQELGIGIGKLYGCGIFLPHKSIAPVAISKDDD